MFAAPALEPSAERRALLVLKLVLSSLRSQLYIGGFSSSASIRKPLNAFLGELFLASWTDHGKGAGATTTTTRLAAEQVSHHPPITAMHLRDDGHGVRADGYARVEMTFSPAKGGVHVRQVGHAVYHVDRYDEDYLIPLPDVKVSGFLSGRLYPEAQGTYTIVSSSGFVSEIKFSGAGLTYGKKNSFEARIYRKDDAKKRSVYEVSGVWSEGWTVRDPRKGGQVVEEYVLDAPENMPAICDVPPLEEQDPWESRRAWAGVISGIENGDFRQTASEKSRLEQAQRQMRTREAGSGQEWEPLLFASRHGDDHATFHRLAEGTDWKLDHDRTKGVWRIDDARLRDLQRPFRGELTPLG